MRIKKILPFILLVFLFISCEKEDFEIETNNQRTVFMYLPWSTNLTSFFIITFLIWKKLYKKKD